MREFDADRQAVLLTGDPEGLAMALNKLEAFEPPTNDIRFYRNHRASTPSILRTHPNTEERIDYLLSLKKLTDRTLKYSNDDRFAIPVHYQKTIRKPRWHFRGLWD